MDDLAQRRPAPIDRECFHRSHSSVLEHCVTCRGGIGDLSSHGVVKSSRVPRLSLLAEGLLNMCPGVSRWPPVKNMKTALLMDEIVG